MNLAFLAQYDIRSKQAYIFKTNAMKEMTGASRLIGKAYDMLMDWSEEAGLHVQRGSDEEFSFAQVKEAFGQGNLQMAELTRGGGNCLVLFDSKESYLRANAVFTRKLLDEAPGMLPLCVGVEVGADGKWDYRDDYKKLQKALAKEKAGMNTLDCVPQMPFSLLDPVTFQPITGQEKGEEVTAESAKKLQSFSDDGKNGSGIKNLEDMIEEKGTESLLAVVHADGNNMGFLVKKFYEQANENRDNETYTLSVNKMRKFTKEANSVFVELGGRAVEKECGNIDNDLKKCGKRHKQPKVRWLVKDGDDVTFVCNARYAKRLTVAYLNAVDHALGKDYSSCAGICIFHSRYPFYMAYQFAEQCCDNAKKKVHKQNRSDMDAAPIVESWIDFHYLHAGLEADLDDSRSLWVSGSPFARPYILKKSINSGKLSMDQLDELYRIFPDDGDSNGDLDRGKRKNIKAIGNAMEISLSKAKAEWDRVCYHGKKDTEDIQKTLAVDEETLLRMIYDMSEVYDLWYSWDSQKKGEERNG